MLGHRVKGGLGEACSLCTHGVRGGPTKQDACWGRPEAKQASTLCPDLPPPPPSEMARDGLGGKRW